MLLNSFNIDSTSFQHVSTRLNGGLEQTVSTSLFNKIEWMLKRMLKPGLKFFLFLSGSRLLRRCCCISSQL